MNAAPRSSREPAHRLVVSLWLAFESAGPQEHLATSHLALRYFILPFLLLDRTELVLDSNYWEYSFGRLPPSLTVEQKSHQWWPKIAAVASQFLAIAAARFEKHSLTKRLFTVKASVDLAVFARFQHILAC